MDKKDLQTLQKKKVEELHWEIQQWKSSLQFMDDEIEFIQKLLRSYIFQPNTADLFELREGFKTGIKTSNTSLRIIQELISKHENILGGMLECTDSACDLTYYRKHDSLKIQVDTYIENFQKLKSEIFSYARGILKNRKPIDS